MRYVIGAKIPNNDGRVVDGFYAIGSCGLPFILSEKSKIDDNEKIRVQVFPNIESIEQYLKKLRQDYRSEFVSRAKQYNLNIADFRLYPVRLDSSKFSAFKVGEKFVARKNNPNLPYSLYYISKPSQG